MFQHFSVGSPDYIACKHLLMTSCHYFLRFFRRQRWTSPPKTWRRLLIIEVWIFLISLISWIQLQLPVLESMYWNTMTLDDSRFSFFFPTPALDISSQKLPPFAFVKKTSFLLCPSLCGHLWHNGLRSNFGEEMSSAGVGKTKKRMTTCHHLMSSYFHSYFPKRAAEAESNSGYATRCF